MKLAAVAALLLTSSTVSAIVPRQDTTSSSSISSSSSSTSLSSTSSTVTASTTSATGSTSSTVSGSAPTVSTGIELPPGNTYCSESEAESIFNTSDYSGSVALCGFSSGNNTIVIPPNGFQTYIKWWTGAFTETNTIVTLHLDWTDDSHKTQWSVDTPATKGFTEIYINNTFLNGGTSSEFRLVLDASGPTSRSHTIGPIVKFSQQNTTPPPPAPTSFNFTGVAIGVPIGVFVIVLVLAVMCCLTRRERGVFARIKLPTRRKGYGVRQSRRQRGGAAVDEFDFDASAPIYRDEPGPDYANSSREERSAKAMGVFSAERNLHSTY